MRCWNCIKLDPNTAPEIIKDYETGRWIEVALGKPHNFKPCWKAVQIKEGNWIEREKPEPKPYVEYAGSLEFPEWVKEYHGNKKRRLEPILVKTL